MLKMGETMKEIVQRIGNIPTGSHADIQKSFKEIDDGLQFKGADFDGILISVNTGIAYAFKNRKGAEHAKAKH